MKTSWASLICLLLGLGSAMAHPVAQGSMDITVHPDHIELLARISPEEVFVAGMSKASKGADSVPALLQIHGPYILDHLFLTLDGKPLQGTVVACPHALNANAPRSLVPYEFSFHFDRNAKPLVLEMRENLINEVNFAVGNRWEASFFVRIAQAGGEFDTGHLLTSRAPLVINASPGKKPEAARWRLATEYLRAGIWHILSGYDHLLFIGALVLAVRSVWDLVKVIGAFTLAHTLTVTLAVLGYVRIPAYIIDPMIPASIVVTALQNILRPESAQGATRLWIAFFFGLFHGLGFAGGLLEAMNHLSGLSVAVAIVAFSLGVEVGHQVVVLPVFFGMRAVRHLQRDPARRDFIPRFAMRYGSIFISLAGLYYFNEALHIPH